MMLIWVDFCSFIVENGNFNDWWSQLNPQWHFLITYNYRVPSLKTYVQLKNMGESTTTSIELILENIGILKIYIELNN